MKIHISRILSILLTISLLVLVGACGYTNPSVPSSGEDIVIFPEGTDAPQQSAEITPAATPETTVPPADVQAPNIPDKDAYYYDVDHVVLYLYYYGELPSNFITKEQARALGWSGGSVEKYKDGAAIGGDNFGNREGSLPKASGRKYRECDIDTHGSNSRGAKRLIYSNDGLFFYTADHYESFVEIQVTQKGEILWK